MIVLLDCELTSGGTKCMTTTIELSDSIYQDVASCAEREGMTIDAYVLGAIRARLAKELARPRAGLMSVFGKGDPEAVADVQRIIDEEFSKIDPEDRK
jgi:hypothetical protein